jgi:hypothetical protein
MKKLFLLLMLIPLLGIGQKNVVSAFRVFPKADKGLEFEKAFIAHVQKYHTGDWKWNVWEIQSGPDYGGFMVTEGPLSWEQFDTRGNLGDAHTQDWAKNVSPLITERTSSTYSVFKEDMSSVALTDYADKILINHYLPKPGLVVGLTDMITRLKKVWTQSNESVAVYSTVGSGAPEYVIVNRMKNGLKELSDDYRKPLPERYNAVHGEGTWKYWLQDFTKNVESRWSEILFKRADLSSK